MIIQDIVSIDAELGAIPRQPSFWLDDLFFWRPIVLDAASTKDLPRDFKVFVTPGWGGSTTYDPQSRVVSIPVGVACEIYNQYAMEMKFSPSVSLAHQIEPSGFFTIWSLYHDWGIDKGPWLQRMVCRSLIEYRSAELAHFLSGGLDRNSLFAGEFLDEMLSLVKDRTIPPKQRKAVRAAIVDRLAPIVPNQPAANVFLSYSERRKEEATRVTIGLEQAGFSVWHYRRDAVPGVPHLEQTKAAIEGCGVFICIMGDGDWKSLWLGTEVLTAAACQKPRFPVLIGIEHSTLPKELQQAFGTAVGVGYDETLGWDGPMRRISDGVRFFLK